MSQSQDFVRRIFKGGNFLLVIAMTLVTVSSAVKHQDIRLSLLGITGSGKSTTGNFLLNKANRFKTSGTSNSETSECSADDVKRDGRNVKVVDTPGFLDTNMNFSVLQERLIPFIGKAAPGPHALLYFTEASRFKPDLMTSMGMYMNIFGEGILKYTIVVFTKLAESTTEMDYISSAHSSLQHFLEKCGRRYIFLPAPEKSSEMKMKIDSLYTVIDKMVDANDGTYYTNKMFEAQQKILEEKLEEQRQREIKEREEEINKIKAEIKKEYEEKIEKLETKLHMSAQEVLNLKSEVKTLQEEMRSKDTMIQNLHNEITLNRQRISDLERESDSSIFSFLGKVAATAVAALPFLL